MNTIKLIAQRELWVTVKRKAYLFMIFGIPVLYAVLIAVVVLVTASSATKIRPRVVALVDSSGVVDTNVLRSLEQQSKETGALSDEAVDALNTRLSQLTPATRALTEETFSGFRGTIALLMMTDADSAREATRRGDLEGALLVSGDYLNNGRVWSYSQTRSVLEDGEGPAERLMRQTLTLSLLQDQNLDPVIQNRILRPMYLTMHEVTERGGEFEESGDASEIRKFALPYIFSLLLMFSIMMGGGFLLQGVAEEKENRVIEVLLSSVTPNNLMAGKVLGLGTAALVQVLIWLGMVFVGLTMASQSFMPDFEVPLDLFFICLGYFLVGFLMISSLMAGVGSLGNTLKESQQLSMWFTMPTVAPLVLMMAILAEPNGLLARIFSYFPLTTPVTMMLRLPSGQVPWWEVPLTFVILIVSVFLALRLGAKLFRLGSLMYGKRPTVPEIWRWLRQA